MSQEPVAIPDAVAAIVQAVLDQRPDCDPDRRGHLIVRELRALGWRIEAPGAVRTSGTRGGR